MRRLIICALMLVTSPATAGVHTPDVETRLSALIGDWTIAGQEQTYREKCDWFGDRAFVVCTTTDRSDGSQSQSVLGYSKAEEAYTYYNFGSGGASNARVGFPHGENGIVYTLERRTSTGRVRTTTFLERETDGRFHFREERSVNGGPWLQAANFYYLPRQ